MSPSGEQTPPEVPVSERVRGLSPASCDHTVEAFFEHFPWVPSHHVRLSQWETQAFFERFVR